jgi:hypothetical protein
VAGAIDEVQRAFVARFLRERRIRTEGELRRAVEEEVARKVEEVRERLRRREEAVRRNERVWAQIRDLEEERAVERRVERMMSMSGRG